MQPLQLVRFSYAQGMQQMLGQMQDTAQGQPEALPRVSGKLGCFREKENGQPLILGVPQMV